MHPQKVLNRCTHARVHVDFRNRSRNEQVRFIDQHVRQRNPQIAPFVRELDGGVRKMAETHDTNPVSFFQILDPCFLQHSIYGESVVPAGIGLAHDDSIRIVFQGNNDGFYALGVRHYALAVDWKG